MLESRRAGGLDAPESIFSHVFWAARENRGQKRHFWHRIPPQKDSMDTRHTQVIFEQVVSILVAVIAAKNEKLSSDLDGAVTPQRSSRAHFAQRDVAPFVFINFETFKCLRDLQ
jgi:hypothetical protein